jgi:hypothetical protein
VFIPWLNPDGTAREPVRNPSGAPAELIGQLLRGVRFDRTGARTQSLVMRSRSGTVRLVDAHHRFTKLQEFSAIDYS